MGSVLTHPGTSGPFQNRSGNRERGTRQLPANNTSIRGKSDGRSGISTPTCLPDTGKPDLYVLISGIMISWRLSRYYAIGSVVRDYFSSELPDTTESGRWNGVGEGIRLLLLQDEDRRCSEVKVSRKVFYFPNERRLGIIMTESQRDSIVRLSNWS